MKKLLSILLVFVLMFSAVGCDKENNSTEVKSSEDCYQQEFYSSMKKYNIIENGVAKYFILLPEDASEILEYAATEVNLFLYKSTGVELPVVYEGQPLPAGMSNYISVGKTDAFNSLGINPKYEELSTDGFRVYVRNKNFYSISNVDRGSLYGCYDILKRYIGLRFLTKEVTHYYAGDTVWFADYDFTCVPDFEMRSFLGWNMMGSADWQPRTTMYSEFAGGIVGSPWAGELGNIHTITDYYVLPALWRESHPEFFSSYTNSVVEQEDVCWSNGITDDGKLDQSMDISVAKIIIDKIITYLKDHPEKQFFMLGIADQWNAYCKCNKCVEREELLGQKSGITTMMVNVVAEEVNKWAQSAEGQTHGIDHDVNIIQFAYYWTLNPPVHEENGKWVVNHPLAKPNKYIFVRYAPLNANYAYSLGADKQLSTYKNVVEGWSAICDNLMLYDYVERLDLLCMYLPHFANISDQAKYLKDHNFYYWFVESIYEFDGVWGCDVVEYILQRLWWDVDADVQAIINEYIELYNGKVAAPYIKQFVDIMEDNLARIKEIDGLTSKVFGISDLTVENYPRPLLEQAMSILDEAQAAIDTSTEYTVIEKQEYTSRLNELKVIPESMMLYNYDSYYLDDKVGKLSLLNDYYNHALDIGLPKHAYNITMKDYYDSIVK